MKNILFSIAFLFCSLFLFQACTQHPKTDLKRFESLLGAWQYYINDSTRGLENWYLDTTGQLKGSNAEINNSKMRITEFLSFYVKEDKVYYVPQLVKDGKKSPTLFEYIDTKDDELMFTNYQNDFPKYISYKFINKDSMDVSIGDDKNQIHMQYSKRAFNIKL